MIDIKASEKWDTIVENANKIDTIINDTQKNGTISTRDIGSISFLSILIAEQAEQILIQNKLKSL